MSSRRKLTFDMLASATIAGLGTYFLGLSSIRDIIGNDDPIQRVVNFKRFLISASIDRGSDRNIKSLYNLANPEDCPPGTEPPGFEDGDEVPCSDAGQPAVHTTPPPPPPPPSTPTPVTSRTQSCSLRDDVGARGMIIGHECICNVGPTPKPTIVNRLYSCPTK